MHTLMLINLPKTSSCVSGSSSDVVGAAGPSSSLVSGEEAFGIQKTGFEGQLPWKQQSGITGEKQSHTHFIDWPVK